MTTSWIVYACLVVGLSSALVAGVFQSFSDFVMNGLIAAKPEGGAESMQMINVTVFRSVFLAMFLALTLVTIAFAAYAYVGLSNPARPLILTGALIYCISVFLVTIFGNVPMNRRLATMDPVLVETADHWRIYGNFWTNWNHVRTPGATATSICFLLAAVSLT